MATLPKLPFGRHAGKQGHDHSPLPQDDYDHDDQIGDGSSVDGNGDYEVEVDDFGNRFNSNNNKNSSNNNNGGSTNNKLPLSSRTRTSPPRFEDHPSHSNSSCPNHNNNNSNTPPNELDHLGQYHESTRSSSSLPSRNKAWTKDRFLEEFEGK